MLGKLLQPELEEMLHAGRYTDLRLIFEDMSPPDIAEMIGELPHETMALFFRILPRSLAADVFEHLELEDQDAMLKALGQEQLAALLNELDPDDRTALLEELPGEVTRRLLALLTPKEQAVARQLLGYPEWSIGRLMTPDYLAIRPDWSIPRVLEEIRTRGHDSETINILYVVDEKGRLLDDIRLRDLILAPVSKTVRDLMDEQFVALLATDDQEVAVASFRKYDRVALPVTDTGGILVGIVTVDDVFDVAEEEATEDIHKFGGLEALDLPYFATQLLTMLRKRAGWLIILFLGEMLTATALGYFEDEIQRATVLAMFMPLIISSGGNSGSQAASLIIRGLALGEVTLRDWWRVMRREILMGVLLGVILGGVGFLRISVWSAFSTIYGPHWILVAATIWVALIGVVLWGTLAGSLLPILMQRLGADPATSSTPFIATLVDVTGLIIYFTVASLILSGTLLGAPVPQNEILHMEKQYQVLLETPDYADSRPVLLASLDSAFKPTTATMTLTGASLHAPGPADLQPWSGAGQADRALGALLASAREDQTIAQFAGDFDNLTGHWQARVATAGTTQALVALDYTFGDTPKATLLGVARRGEHKWEIARWLSPAAANPAQ